MSPRFFATPLVLFCTVVTGFNITVRFDNAENYFKATEVILDSNTFIEGQVYDSYQGLFVLLEDEKLRISSAREYLSKEKPEKFEDPGDTVETLYKDDAYVESIIVDLDTCVLAAYDEPKDASEEASVRAVEGIQIRTWSWTGLIRYITKRSWASQYVRRSLQYMFGNPGASMWTEFEDGNIVYHMISCSSSGQRDTVALLDMIDLASDWAKSNIPQHGDVRSSILLRSTYNKNLSSCVKYYRQDWKDKTPSPCAINWCGHDLGL